MLLCVQRSPRPDLLLQVNALVVVHKDAPQVRGLFCCRVCTVCVLAVGWLFGVVGRGRGGLPFWWLFVGTITCLHASHAASNGTSVLGALPFNPGPRI